MLKLTTGSMSEKIILTTAVVNLKVYRACLLEDDAIQAVFYSLPETIQIGKLRFFNILKKQYQSGPRGRVGKVAVFQRS